MNNKPVAWMQDYQNCKCPDNEARCFSDLVFRMMQKHTHPVKELTDEEIDYEFDEFVWTGNRRADFELIARAILRKAIEK